MATTDHVSLSRPQRWLRLAARAVPWLVLGGGLVAAGFYRSQLWGMLATAVVVAVSLGYRSPLRRPLEANERTWAPVWLPAVTAALGVLAPMLACFVFYGGDPLPFYEPLSRFLVVASIVSAGVVLGGVLRGFARLDGKDRAMTLLILQWMAAPRLLPDLLFLVLAAMGFDKDWAFDVTQHELLMIGIIVAGALSSSRLWRWGLVSSAIGLVGYWAAFVAQVYYFQILQR